MRFLNALIERNMRDALAVMAVQICAWLVLLFLEYLGNRSKANALQKMCVAMREDISVKLLHKTYQEFHQMDLGSYLSWYSSDMNQVEQLGFIPFFDFMTACAKLVFSLGVLTYVHWILGATALVLAAVMMAVSKLQDRRMKKKGASFSSAQEKFIEGMKDLLSGIDVMRSFGIMSRFQRDTSHCSSKFEQEKRGLSVTKANCSVIVSTANTICQLASCLCTGVLSIVGIIPVQTILGSGNLSGMVFNSLQDIARQRLAIVSSKPFFEKLARPPEYRPTKPQDTQVLNHLQTAIQLRNVSYRYGKHKVLADLTLTFEAGKKYALVGSSGCGKSTILKIVLGQLQDYQGEIRFDDRNYSDISADMLCQQMAYIEQDVFLFNTTIRENITLGHEFTDLELSNAIKASALDLDMALIPDQLETVVGENGCNISGGQKQRVAIARALIHQRSILLIDEGTSALDQKNADIVEESLLSNQDLTLILISHHLSDQQKLRFDHVYEMQPVERIDSGAPEQLTKRASVM